MSVTWNHEIRDGNMIYREGCCLSTDTKPTSDPTLGNGSKLLEMDTSEMWIYDADGCEWFGPDGALNDTIRFIRPKLIYNDEYVGIDFRLKLPSGKTPSDYPGSYVTLSGSFDSKYNWNASGAAVNASTQWPLETVEDDGAYHVQMMIAMLQTHRSYIPTFNYTENGTNKTIVGGETSVENALEFEIARVSGRYAEGLKSYADLCYYGLLYQTRSGTGANARTTLHYSDYNKDVFTVRRLYSEYLSHDETFKDENITAVASALVMRVKWAIQSGAVAASGYTVSSGSIDDVPVAVTTGGGRKILTTPYFSMRNGLAHVFEFKYNDVLRLRESILGWFAFMVHYESYADISTLFNYAYAVLQYAKITHQI